MVFPILVLLALPLAAQPAAGSSGWVTLPVPEYNALRAKVSPDAEPPPLESTITRAIYELTLERETLATGKVTLSIDVFRDGWTQTLLPSGLVASSANLPPGCRLVEGAIAFTAKGHYDVQLSGSMPLLVTGGEQRLAISPAAGVTRVSIKPARQDTEMTVSGGVHEETMGDAWAAYANGAEPLILSWRRKSGEPVLALPLRQSGTLVQLWALGEDTSSFTAEMTLDVTQGSAQQLQFDLPAALTVNQVLGGNVADWTAAAGKLTVTFLEPAEKQTRFLIQGEAKLAREGELNLPLLRALGLEREQGGVAVELSGPAEIRSAKPAGLEAAEAAQVGGLAATRQSPSLAAFRYLPRAASRGLTVQVARYTPQAMLTANIEEARIQTLIAGDGKLLVRARYAVRNNQRSFLKMTLPPGAALWSASLGGRPVRPGQGGENSLMFPLSKPAGSDEAPALLAEVTYLIKAPAWTGRGRASVALPKVDLPVSRTGVTLYLPARYRVTPEPGAFRAGPWAAPESPAFAAPISGPSPAPVLASNIAAQNAQILVDKFRAKRDSRQPARIAGPLDFPSYGPSLFLTTELTAENQEPRIEVSYQPDQKGAGK